MTLGLQLKTVFQRLDWPFVLKHILGWALFIAYEIGFVRFTTGSAYPVADYICYYGLNITLFYFNALMVFPAAIKSRKSYLALPTLIVLEMLLYLCVKYILDYFLAAQHRTFFSQLAYIQKFLVMNIFRGIYFIGFSTLYWAVMRMIRYKNRAYETEKSRLTTLKDNAELERNLAEARNAYLQQQISPHFLFNTLAFIHNTFYKFSREAAKCVLLLVELMRYSFDEVDSSGTVPLNKEVEQIRNFIELNQLRYDFELYIDVRMEGKFDAYRIIPLILLTLTENVFKHGYLKEKENKANLDISVNGQNELRFFCRNAKRQQSESKRMKSIGIKNVIKRLDFTYEHRYTLDIKDEDDFYELELRVQL